MTGTLFDGMAVQEQVRNDIRGALEKFLSGWDAMESCYVPGDMDDCVVEVVESAIYDCGDPADIELYESADDYYRALCEAIVQWDGKVHGGVASNRSVGILQEWWDDYRSEITEWSPVWVENSLTIIRDNLGMIGDAEWAAGEGASFTEMADNIAGEIIRMRWDRMVASMMENVAETLGTWK